MWLNSAGNRKKLKEKSSAGDGKRRQKALYSLEALLPFSCAHSFLHVPNSVGQNDAECEQVVLGLK